VNDGETTKHFQESVLKDAPRLKIDDEFQFACHPGVRCFNECCADVNIFLTPYDIVRLKHRLGVTSGEFLERYTIIPFTKEQRLPVVVLKMSEEGNKSCPLVSERGCSVYEDRPWACRMYPLGLASPTEVGPGQEEFYFLMQEEGCRGFDEAKTQKISQWLVEQGVLEYNEMGELFKKLTLHPRLQGDVELTMAQMDMVHMALYDLDRFRRFVFGSSLLQKIDVPADRVELMRGGEGVDRLASDVELMTFALEWLRFSIGREPTLQVKHDLRSQKEKELSGVIDARREAALKQKKEQDKSA
jgi:Fe-S-cluster containining protein